MLKLQKLNSVWYIMGSVDGKRIRKSTKVPVAVQNSQKIANQMRLDMEMAMYNGTGDVDVTFDDALLEYRKLKQWERRLSADMESKIAKIETYWTGRKLSEITTKAVSTYVEVCLGNLKPGSIRRYLNQLRAILKNAEELYNWRCPKIIMPEVDDARDTHLEADEVNQVLGWIRKHEPRYYPHFLLLFDTGARLGEMLSLTTNSFRDGNVLIRRQMSKNRQKTLTRNVPMTDEVKDLRFPIGGLDLWNCPKSASSTLNKVLKRACLGVGIMPIRLHDCRHTFAYLAAKAGADIADLQHLMGHKDISMTQRYRGFVQSRAKNVIRGIR